MSEQFKFERPKEIFKVPDIFAEQGEFERVAQELGIEGLDSSVLMFRAQSGSMVPLSERMWANLENTDSYAVTKDGHDVAENLANQAERDYRAVAEAVYAGQTMLRLL